MLEAFSHGRHHVLGQADVCAPVGSGLICFTAVVLICAAQHQAHETC